MLRGVLLALILLRVAEVGAQSSAPRQPPTPNAVIMQFVRFADIFGSRLVAAFEAIPEAK